MKRKSLERAVFFTVLMMSLHGVTGAAELVTADNTDKDVSVNQESIISVDDGNSNGLQAINNGSISVIGNGKLTIQKNKYGDAIAVGTNTYKDDAGSKGILTINDGVQLIVNMNVDSAYNKNVSGIHLTGNSSEISIGNSGLKIDMTVTDNNTSYIRGINQENGMLTANGFVDIDIKGSTKTYVTAIDLHKKHDNPTILNLNKGADITIEGNASETASAVGIYSLSGAQLKATDKVTLNISNASKNYGVIVGHTDVDSSKENLHLNNLEATISGGNENLGIQVHGGLAVVENANITAMGGSERNAGIWTWSKNGYVGAVELGNGIIEVTGGKRVYGLQAQQNSTIEANGIISVTAKDASEYNYGILSEASSVDMNGAITTVIAQNGKYNYAVFASSNGSFTSDNLLQVKAENGTNGNYAIYANGGKISVADAIINASGKNAFGVVSKTVGGTASDVTFNGTANIEAGIAARANGADSVVTFKNGFTAGTLSATQLQAMAGGLITVNSSGNGIVNYNGVTHMEIGNGSAVDMNLNNKESYWNLTGSSELRDLNVSNNALLDMTKDSAANSILYVTGDMSGDSGIIKMAVDAMQDNVNDSLIIGGTHSGTHYLDLNVINATADNDIVVGKLLVSVADEQGEFKANDVEGALYWNSFELEAVNSQTQNYDKDWVITGIKQKAENTTSVDTIVGANALNYHTWRAENDQLMQRMGELRSNGSDEQGAWFRMHGAEISHDDIAGFENKYTTYELGYDQITKQTEYMTRYTGAALSYTDGSSSYNSGSGENHSKAISFYNTDIYSSGHYLDLVFKFANMDNDFSVYDTKGQNITGEYKNNGISLSAEYGRKNEMANGWYIEPQAQLTLGYFGGDEYETSNGIKVNQGGIASVLGRAGFNLGKELGSNGVIYAKASLLHEFAGDYDIRMTDSTGISRNESASFNDTWFEYGVGAALKTGKNNHLYFDFVKTAGGSFEKDWQWNAGMRWTF